MPFSPGKEQALLTILNYPFAVLFLSLALLWLAVQIGGVIGRRKPITQDQRDDLTVITNASLTLLALIIGFTFSMAVTRYDQRKNYEEEEANAIGTEYARATLIPGEKATQVQALLREYLDSRIAFYETRDIGQLQLIDQKTAAPCGTCCQERSRGEGYPRLTSLCGNGRPRPFRRCKASLYMAKALRVVVDRY